jgi:glucose-1-phosphate thymidylyltransferase
MRPHTWSRPKALLNIAGHTVIGHLLDRMADVTTKEVIFVVGYKGDEIKAWVGRHYSHLDAHFVIQEEQLGQAHALWLCREFFDDGQILIAFGDGIVEADYTDIPATDADAVCLVQEVEDPRKFGVVAVNEAGYITNFIEKPTTMEHKLAIAGIYWFRHGRDLFQALDTVISQGHQTKGEYYLADAYRLLLRQGMTVEAKPTILWLDAGNPTNIFSTNARLLSLGFGSQNALERSYVEKFTVLPPVFIHDSAKIENAIIGPYANIEANVTVKNAIVRNSIIDAGAHIENVILDEALVGENANVTGHSHALFVGDDSTIELG